MYAVLAKESLTSLCSNTESTMDTKDSPCLHAHNHISNSAILNNCFVALCTCVKFWKWHRLWSHSCSVTGLNCLMRVQSCEKVMGWCTAQCKMLLFCAKTVVKESRNFELAHLKKKKKKERKTFWLSSNFLVQYFHNAFTATRHVVGHETLENEW